MPFLAFITDSTGRSNACHHLLVSYLHSVHKRRVTPSADSSLQHRIACDGSHLDALASSTDA